MKKNSKEKKYISIPQLGYLFFCVVSNAGILDSTGLCRYGLGKSV